MQKEGGAEPEMRWVPLQVQGFSREGVETLDERLIAVVVPQRVEEPALGAVGDEGSKPSDGCIERVVDGRQRGPAEVEDVPVEHEEVGLGGRPADIAHVRIGHRSVGEQMQVGDHVSRCHWSQLQSTP